MSPNILTSRNAIVGVLAVALTIAAGPATAAVDSDALDKRADALLAQMTLAEKVSLMAGNSQFSTTPVPRLGIPSLRMADGPNGIRTNETWPATVFPASIATAATWNPGLAARISGAIAEEARAFNYQVVLGPAMNIDRTPLGGRTFEYFSEDPFLTGRIARAWVNGVQDAGLGAAPKHFAANNQELNRKTVNSVVSERVLREIYLSGFRDVVEQADPWMLMTSYNRLNGTFTSENKWLLRDVLRGDWKYRGVVLSDWGAVHSTAPSANAGLDLEMPGPPKQYGAKLVAAVEQGEVKRATIDESARRVLRLILRSGLMEKRNPVTADPRIDPDAHRQVALDGAAEAITLLKNDGSLLPLDPARLKRIAVIGPNADARVIQGGGSSEVVPLYAVTPLEGLRSALGRSVAIDVAKGADNDRYPPVADPRLFSTTMARTDQGLKASFWANSAMAGAPARTVTDTVFMRFYFGEDIAANPARDLAVRWEGVFWPPVDGEYDFSTFDHGNVDLTIASQKLFDRRDPAAAPPMYEFLKWQARYAKTTLKAGRGYPIRIEFHPGWNDYPAYRIGIRTPSGKIADAVAAARNADVALVFVGSSTTSEAEGADRETLSLYGEQDALIRAVAAANPRTVVVVGSGGPMAMPWIDQVPAVVESWFLGGNTGVALAHMLLGRSNPSGKLPITFPKVLADNPTAAFYGKDLDANYGEGLLVGYRWYDAHQIEPLFPFGFGLSYTQFRFSNLKTQPRGGTWQVSADVTNTGKRSGAEVAQLYLGAPKAPGEPPRQLRGFEKVMLAPGETRTVSFSLDRDDFSRWDEKLGQWQVTPGAYRVSLGSSSRDLPLQGSLEVAAER
jgi:beta-glucosidase